MNVLIVDMTHGGALIATEFSKIKDYNVFALDIYNTLSEEKKAILTEYGIKFVEKDFLNEKYINNELKTDFKDNFKVIAPIHSNIESDVYMTHHEAVNFLLKNKVDIPFIEVTGVKGKTSVVWMLKEIFKDLNPLILSSLGVEVIENGESTFLKREISITPASIIEAWKLSKSYNIGMGIFETSLGGTGLADVGIITNIAENYSIASGKKTASQAKAQIFNNKLIVCDYDDYNEYYSHINANVNTFGINPNATVSVSQIDYGLNKTTFKVNAKALKTKNGHILNTTFDIETFAPAEYHVLNALCAITASLSMNTPLKHIIRGLKRFKGIQGRTSIREYKNTKIIEEINPGINVTAIKKSVQMMENSKSSAVIFGGKYGITCEEIDEETTAEFLNKLNENILLFLVDELGENIKSLIKRKYKYTDFNNAIYNAIKMNSKIILLIYRSNYSDISKR
ncbi:MAG: coenzyme F430 synthase [Methanobacterium sp.]